MSEKIRCLLENSEAFVEVEIDGSNVDRTGFKRGDRITTINGDQGTFVGVGTFRCEDTIICVLDKNTPFVTILAPELIEKRKMINIVTYEEVDFESEVLKQLGTIVENGQNMQKFIDSWYQSKFHESLDKIYENEERIHGRR